MRTTTRFRFLVRVLSGGRRVPVQGALIRFLGRRLVTNALGRASTRARFARPGHHLVVVTKPGTHGVTATVRVFPPRPERGGVDEHETPCLSGRWPVKTASDRRARLIDPVPLSINLTTLWQIPPPPRFRLRRDTPRFRGIERQVFVMRVRLVAIQLQADRDIHLVVAEPGHPRRTMITEFPHPNCHAVLRGRFPRQIRRARAALQRTCGLALRRPRRIVGTGIVTGVGFWDSRHGQGGVARNGIELHPVIGFVGVGCRTARRRPR